MRLSFLRSTRNLLILLSLAAILLAGGTYALLTLLHHVTPKTLNGHLFASQVYFGVHVPGQLWNLNQVEAFERDVNKPVSIVMWYQGWGVPDSSRYFQPVWMNNVRNHGAIPMVTWEPWNYTHGINQPEYSLKNIINGRYDDYIAQWALASKAWGHPYFLRFAEEMNGNWFSWSEQVNGNGPGQYVQAWQHVHDIFTGLGVTNVTWVWSPNVEYNASTPLAELYPGSAYVDWIGMDGYNWSTIGGHRWQSFSQVFQQTYLDILGMSLNKPLMVAETASAEIGGNKAAWITDAFTVQIPQFFPAIKAVIWFDEKKETDWRIESSLASKTAFARSISLSLYASNQFAAQNGLIIRSLSGNNQILPRR
jgi:hypothetical protein